MYFCFQFIQVAYVTQELLQLETGVDYIVYFYYLFKDKYRLSDWQNYLDCDVYRKIQKIFLQKEVDDFRVQELAILELEPPCGKIDEVSLNVVGYFGKENFRFQLENHGKYELANKL